MRVIFQICLTGIHKLPLPNHGSLQNSKQGSLTNYQIIPLQNPCSLQNLTRPILYQGAVGDKIRPRFHITFISISDHVFVFYHICHFVCLRVSFVCFVFRVLFSTFFVFIFFVLCLFDYIVLVYHLYLYILLHKCSCLSRESNLKHPCSKCLRCGTASGLVIQRSVTKAEAKLPEIEIDQGRCQAISKDIKDFKALMFPEITYFHIYFQLSIDPTNKRSKSGPVVAT